MPGKPGERKPTLKMPATCATVDVPMEAYILLHLLHLLSQHHRSFRGGTYACPLQRISVFDALVLSSDRWGSHRVRSS